MHNFSHGNKNGNENVLSLIARNGNVILTEISVAVVFVHMICAVAAIRGHISLSVLLGVTLMDRIQLNREIIMCDHVIKITFRINGIVCTSAMQRLHFVRQYDL